ncbi:pre-mRNA-processing factor 39-like isoform X2 [Mya arenaria]|uniref:pre-mRNA-processing factor 39-like isoform X2 n=1 Tax=Mya arenaria TaxID=6604 RepID=UPI0022E20AC8|nr:pre-mRNA-processing factor 39-like isoform X2 [Mya arenaria]XP_052766185.1 pre-mRNA-processing factor 39-like isoform X2 [Mya arenaria]XP_052766186.1 pre-mRNA-processing factor 39-like isoform X2 [Mya arenaria]XP_052766187.1 pre-mRNA-processing factor 39-like isoform X2 [Mya arenaria]
MVFERGVQSIPLSSELWLHYIQFYIKELKNVEGTRKLYERAITAAGTDFRSDKLWDNYINWEKMTDLQRVTGLYDRLFRIPTQLYSHHYDNFKKHVLNHHPKQILDLDEFIRLRLEVVSETDPSSLPPSDDAPPGEEAPPGIEPGDDKEGGSLPGDVEEINKVRDKILKEREVAFKQNEEEVSKRWTFEEGIKRPYFHVKPLERSQLKNWREYLDFEIQNGMHERVVVLFERSMIATALYEDFWLKYARYLEDHFMDLKKAAEDTEKTVQLDEQCLQAVRSVYKRACTVHLPKKPYVHLAWAAFEERQGRHNDAWKILSNLEEVLPGMVMVAMRRISLERRIGNREKTEILFQEYIEKASDLNVRAFYVIKYARYMFKVLGDEIRARKILMDALEKDPRNEKLYVSLLDMEYQKHPINLDSALEIFSKAIESADLTTHMKIKMSQRRLEFLEDFGSSIVQLKECYEDHQKLIKDLQAADKKRKAPEAGANGDDTSTTTTTTNTSAVSSSTATTAAQVAVPPPEKKMKTNGAIQQPTPPMHQGMQPQVDYSGYWAQYQNQGMYNYGGWGGYGQYYNS